MRVRVPDGLYRRKLKEYWGMQHDGRTYFQLPTGEFYELRRDPEHGYLATMPAQMLSPQDPTGAIIAGAMFGALGAIAANAANSNERRDQYTDFTFLLSTGRFEPTTGVGEREVEPDAPTPLLVASSKFSNRDVRLAIQLADGKEVVLGPDQFTSVPTGAQLCYTIDGGEPVCESVAEAVDKKQDKPFARLLVKKKDARVEWMRYEDAALAWRRIEAGGVKLME